MIKGRTNLLSEALMVVNVLEKVSEKIQFSCLKKKKKLVIWYSFTFIIIFHCRAHLVGLVKMAAQEPQERGWVSPIVFLEKVLCTVKPFRMIEPSKLLRNSFFYACVHIICWLTLACCCFGQAQDLFFAVGAEILGTRL